MSGTNGGHNPGNPALTPEEVRGAVEEFRAGRPAASIAADLNVTPAAIYHHVRKAGVPMQQPHRSPSEVRASSTRMLRSVRALGSEAPPAEAVLAVAVLGARPDWQVEGLCAETDPEQFFPEKGGSNRQVKAVCGRCPVRDACLEYALANGERFGIWGGLSERERRDLLRRSA
jgi:hypothetical protein